MKNNRGNMRKDAGKDRPGRRLAVEEREAAGQGCQVAGVRQIMKGKNSPRAKTP